MPILNVEIKAKCTNPEKVHQILRANNARFVGVDHQVDTYFKCKQGRLKLRQGTIENALIHYQRSDLAGPKDSVVQLYPTKEAAQLEAVLSEALHVWKVVDKKRVIYFIDNVKFHVDEVQDLGAFVEIEAIDESGNLGRNKLSDQCNHYLQLLDIKEVDLLNCSYSDMLPEKT